MEAIHLSEMRPAGAGPGEPGPVSLGDNERWYAVYCLPFAELRAEGNLRNQAFRTFLPKRHRTVRHARRLTTTAAPFFPRYLFAILDLTRHQWRKVNGTVGVSRLVMRGDWPQPVPPGVVEALAAAADANGVLHFGHNLAVGGSVRLMAGPFADQIAVLDRLDDSGRVRVLLDILGRRVPISTHAAEIMPVATA